MHKESYSVFIWTLYIYSTLC